MNTSGMSVKARVDLVLIYVVDSFDVCCMPLCARRERERERESESIFSL